MSDKKDFDKYQNSVIDIEELSGTDIKINPEYYIHKALENAQTCLMDNDIKTGSYKFSMLVEHIQILSEAAKLIPDDYEETIKKYSETLQDKDEIIKHFKIANKKLGLLTKGVFEHKVITDPMLI